ncbi:MAG TPA: single-stranded-DNA-specific exonuclease RecJ [Solirubrobacteraceae bacterium]|nr:single-stranded-DNA-specific exonuclease RecJ [Solirubrobacteraceae bacterium]
MRSARLDIPPAPAAAIARLREALAVSDPLAQVLVRRGLTDPAAAREFLTGEPEHDPGAFAGIDIAVETILVHVRAHRRITVHGDYDVDGVCSTAVLVRALRGLGAEVDWYLPDRMSDGYGLSRATVERLASRGTELLLTADCAVTAVEEVAHARALGLSVVVSDHHSPRADGQLPDAPLVHPALCGYPCPDLCAAGVAHKLAFALYRAAGADDAPLHADADLVALATVADVVPLKGENRTLVRRGLRQLAVTEKPGLRALMAVAGVDPTRVDARALGFGLAPRINAAGRLHRADAGLELMLTTDEARAGEIARELDRANAERRDTETRILFEAEGRLAEQGERHGHVLAGVGWHPGVIGIVASRLAERRHRPVVVIGVESGSERGRGSGRSISGFDLLGALRACGEHLERFGGHRAAAGLEIDAAQVDAFAEAFDRHAAAVLGPEDLVPRERVDAIVGGDEVGLELAEELARLQPCGHGNPPATVLVPAARLSDPRPMGEGRHVRFTVHSGGARAQAVAFGSGARLPGAEGREVEVEPIDATFALQVNEWRGAVEPRLVLRQALPCEPAPITLLGVSGDPLEAVWAELDAPLPGQDAPVGEAPGGTAAVDRRGTSSAAGLRRLAHSGEGLLVLVAEVHRRERHLRGRVGGFSLCDYVALERDPGLAGGVAHLLLLDPPAIAAHAALVHERPIGQQVHLYWGEPELRCAQYVHDCEYGLRESLAALYRQLRDNSGASGPTLRELLLGEASGARSPALAGRLLRVLCELGLIELSREDEAIVLLDPVRTELERSAAFRAYTARHQAGLRYLTRRAPRAA